MTAVRIELDLAAVSTATSVIIFYYFHSDVENVSFRKDHVTSESKLEANSYFVISGNLIGL